MQKLKKENGALKTELELENRAAQLGEAGRASTQIAKMQDQGDIYTRKIELEKRREAEVEKQMKFMQGKLLQSKQQMGGVNAPMESNQAIGKQVKVLENRLDKALVRFNEAIAHNKQLREEIDNLRRERVVFDGIYKKLQRDLAEKKKGMANIIEVANIAYEARDQAQSEMAALKSQADKEHKEFEGEWKDLGDQIEDDRRHQDFLSRERNRTALDSEKRGEMSIEEEGQLKKKVVKGQWSLAKDKASTHAAVEKVHSYEEAFEKIKQATGITDIDELVNRFIEAEDGNFSLFNYLNELNNEIEKSDEQLADLRAEMDKYKGQDRGADSQRKKVIKELDENVVRTESKAEQYEAKFQSTSRAVAALGTAIQSVCQRTGCNTDYLNEIGEEDGISESTMMVYLGVVEQKSNEIFQQYLVIQKDLAGPPSLGQDNGSLANLSVASLTPSTSMTMGPQTPVGLTSVTINPPTTGEELDSDEASEDEERPLSRDELKAKTIRGITKRESVKKQSRPKQPPNPRISNANMSGGVGPKKRSSIGVSNMDAL